MLVSVVVPVLDEQDCVAELARRVRSALTGAGYRYEILFVDDGSSDDTPARLEQLHHDDEAIKYIRFTRSFGHQAALIAGLRAAAGHVVVTMDGDLQHPPEVLPEMCRLWREGVHVVHAVRRQGSGSGLKDWASRGFYRVMSVLASVDVQPAAADFRLMDRSAVDAFNDLEEHFVFSRGLVPWLGYETARIDYDVADRFAGHSKYDVWRMLRLAMDGIFSFSVVPLRLIALLGFATILFGVAFGAFALVSHVTGRVDHTGWTSVVVLILIFGGVQLLSLGIVSEYVGRVYEEVKRRPRYVIEHRCGFE